jgi:hypothetical protein
MSLQVKIHLAIDCFTHILNDDALILLCSNKSKILYLKTKNKDCPLVHMCENS